MVRGWLVAMAAVVALGATATVAGAVVRVIPAAVKAVVPYAMERLRLVRLESPVFEWNPASMRVLEKCGFTREAVLKASVCKDGQLIDSVLYAFIDPTHS